MNGRGTVYVVGSDHPTNKMWLDAGYSILTQDIANADIVCFIGGWDVNPELYGEKKNPKAHVNFDANADKRDKDAWDKISPKSLKVGICRGGQFLNVMNGGKLYQHVSGHAGHHKAYDTIWRTEIDVTSSHHQIMIPTSGSEVFCYAENIGSDYRTEDGEVAKPAYDAEILWYDRTKSLCVQPHPEWQRRGIPFHDYFFKLVDLVQGKS